MSNTLSGRFGLDYNASSPRMNSSRILVVGAGFAGAVAARELALRLERKILVIDERDHVAGNCHTERDPGSGVMLHRYGPHIFHTSREEVWNYVRSFSEFGVFTHRIKASTGRGVFGLPINLGTINQFFGQRFSPDEARAFIAGLGDQTIGEPGNFEEQALKYVGRELYEAFFYGYTRKQWGCEPRELPASILKRLPVRFNYDDDYYGDRFQGIPVDGYTAIIARILEHPLIEVQLGRPWQAGMADDFGHVIFTGPLDQYYDYRFGRLGYRTVFWERLDRAGDFQGCAQMNYTGLEVPFTRKIEHKHFAPWESHERTVVFTEFSKETGPADTRFYPKGLAPDRELLARYLDLARQEEKVSFLGRLATYRYLDMHQVIGESLDFAPRLAAALQNAERRPVLPMAG
jgi:UDP-galactopyranose mutase